MRCFFLPIIFTVFCISTAIAGVRADVKALFDRGMSVGDFSEIMVEVERIINPQLDGDAMLAEIDRMANHIRTAIPQNAEEWEKIGVTHGWDSFRSPDTANAVGKIYGGQSIDQYYDDLAKQAATETKFTVARKSRPGNEYDLKATYPGHENKSYHGFLLDGAYTSLREAGNMLAGQNAAALGVPWTGFQQSAGRLHNSNVVTFPLRELAGKVFGTAPNWGENDYQRTRSFYGYMKGTFLEHPSHPR